MAYLKTTWVDKVTPLSASNMNKIEDKLSSLDETKADKTVTDALNETKVDKTSIAKASGTTAPTQGGAVTLSYPDGYNISNCMVLGYKIVVDATTAVSNAYADRVQINLASGGIYVYTNHNTLIGKPISIWLYK